ncbi:MAG TPA: hypothetical protein VK939_04570 [Longimicrobiales bacterium]|nr:hypothetical protein [Longimicrobiales bacterium]
MYYDEESGASGFIAGLLLGALLGISAALLAAPQSGRSTRRRLIRAVSPARLRGGREDALDDEVEAAVRAGRRRAGL